MTNREIFLKVARREMTPYEGADQMRASDVQAQAQARPKWMPQIAWMICFALVTGLLSAFGLRRDA